MLYIKDENLINIKLRLLYVANRFALSSLTYFTFNFHHWLCRNNRNNYLLLDYVNACVLFFCFVLLFYY